MSNRHFPYASPDEIDYHREAEARRVEQARKRLTVSDVLAQVDDLISQEADERKHPLFHLVEFCLDHTLACHGGELFDRCRTLVLTAIDQLVADALAEED